MDGGIGIFLGGLGALLGLMTALGYYLFNRLKRLETESETVRAKNLKEALERNTSLEEQIKGLRADNVALVSQLTDLTQKAERLPGLEKQLEVVCAQLEADQKRLAAVEKALGDETRENVRLNGIVETQAQQLRETTAELSRLKTENVTLWEVVAKFGIERQTAQAAQTPA